MTDPSGGRAARLAELLGAAQEARRLGHGLVGSEHLLMATFSDPVVRTALDGVGCDLSRVQALVTRAGGERERPCGGHVRLTGRAADLIERACERLPEIDLDRTPDPRLYSTALGLVMLTLLHDDADTAAARILDELGVREHAATLASVLEPSAGSSRIPRAE